MRPVIWVLYGRIGTHWFSAMRHKLTWGLCAQETFKKMLVQRARSVHWKKWAAGHEYEELKDGAPALGLLRKKVKEDWTEQHRNVTRKVFLEGGWKQKRPIDIGWLDISPCQACQMEEGTEKHRLYHCPEWHAARRLMSWQKQEQCWTKDSWQKREQKLCSRKERRCTQHCSMRPASIVWYSCKRRARIRNIEQGGVRKQTNIDA